ncbi:MAG: EAL domain-containing protein [Acidobacteria bacterium]|nr:EAL domain-containing protein [Acidobacteriota bacterium]
MDFPFNAGEKGQPTEELRLLGLAVDATNRAILILDEDRRIIYANHAFTDLFGYTRDEVTGKRPSEFLPGPDTDTATFERLRQGAWHNQVVHGDTLLYSKSGREIWVSASVSPIRDKDGQATNLVIVLVDITETKQIQNLQRVVLEAVASGLPLAGVADLICRRVEAISPGVYSSMLLVDDEGRLHPLAGPSLPQAYSASLGGRRIGARAGSCGTAAYLGKTVIVTDIGTDPLWDDFRSQALLLGFQACWSSPIKMRDGRVAGTFAFYYKEKRGPSAFEMELVSACLHLSMLAIETDDARQKIAQLSHFDTLTGLPNRQSLYDKASDLLPVEQGNETAFFALDLDHFKDINDTLGHSVGDRILIEAAYRLQKLTHPHGIVSRTEGDVFMIVLPNCNVSRASAMADRILDALRAPINVSGLSLSTSASIGISIAQDQMAPGIFAEQAVSAMQQAKSAGRACYYFYNPEQNQIAKDRLILGNALRSAFASESIHLVYQPKVQLKTLELTGVEALSRWNDALLGEIAPGKFIPLAEEIGQIEAIGYWSLREACRQMAAWRREGVAVPNVSVNLSPLHFLNRSLTAFIAGILAEFHLSASCLTIEITEGVMVGQNQESLATAMALHDIGVALSIDDFGTGFSSLSRLARLPVKELKLDDSFVRNIEEDPNAQAVATAVISIGHSLGITVVSEGVETEKQARLLERLGCEVAQGFLFGKPMRADEMEAYLAHRETRLSRDSD